MPIIDEKQLINLLSNAKNVLLLEPPFCRSYVPNEISPVKSIDKNKFLYREILD